MLWMTLFREVRGEEVCVILYIIRKTDGAVRIMGWNVTAPFSTHRERVRVEVVCATNAAPPLIQWPFFGKHN